MLRCHAFAVLCASKAAVHRADETCAGEWTAAGQVDYRVGIPTGKPVPAGAKTQPCTISSREGTQATHTSPHRNAPTSRFQSDQLSLPALDLPSGGGPPLTARRRPCNSGAARGKASTGSMPPFWLACSKNTVTCERGRLGRGARRRAAPGKSAGVRCRRICTLKSALKARRTTEATAGLQGWAT